MLDTIEGNRSSRGASQALVRMVGPATAVFVGVGVAIGSGIFKAPGEIANCAGSPWAIMLVWLFAGLITLLQSLVTAELATRFPKAGSDYQFLKEAYGEFAAFFFGWSYTIFIIGGGAATIAAALGGFAADLCNLKETWAQPVFAVGAIVMVTVINAAGLKAGAITQNVLTVLKVAAVLGIAVGAFVLAGRATPAEYQPTQGAGGLHGVRLFLIALLPAFWSYAGATDTAKLAEEIKDVRRSLPRALVGGTLLLTGVYCVFNYALLAALPPAEMAGRESVPAAVFQRLSGFGIAEVILLVSVLVCFGALSSTILSTVRVTFALARDGLAFRSLGRMSSNQAPVWSLIVICCIASAFASNQSFFEMLEIYFVASAILYGMSYMSLIVFRLRDRRAGRAFPDTAYRAPLGVLMALLLVLIQLALCANILYSVFSDWRNEKHHSLWTLAILAAIGLFYRVWKRFGARSASGL
ncbi:MAG: amino acid permease [Planctomycetota bacterium]